MSHSENPAKERLIGYLYKAGYGQFTTLIEPLTPDASTREYFRLRSGEKSFIACVYPQSEFGVKQLDACLDVTSLFLAGELPVAKIEASDRSEGIIIHEDFGDNILRSVMLKAPPIDRDELLSEAIALISKIQAATPIAFERNSIASQLKFDEDKLLWELNFFKTHYFESLIKSPLASDDDQALTKEFIDISRELAANANVLCHRDFHAANLMVAADGSLKIIDHQDARLGSVAYDLVSLLLDRVTERPDPDWLESKKQLFLAYREQMGLDQTPYDDFNSEFRQMTVQRCLKAIGTFANQAANHGKQHYVDYIRPMFQIVKNACDKLERFPELVRIIKRELNS